MHAPAPGSADPVAPPRRPLFARRLPRLALAAAVAVTGVGGALALTGEGPNGLVGALADPFSRVAAPDRSPVPQQSPSEADDSGPGPDATSPQGLGVPGATGPGRAASGATETPAPARTDPTASGGPAATTGPQASHGTDAPTRTEAPTSTQPPPATDQPTDPTPPAPATSTPAVTGLAIGEAVRLLNAERARVGCAALRVNGALTAAATAHSRTLARTGRDDGGSPATRAAASGWSGSAVREFVLSGPATSRIAVATWLADPAASAAVHDCALTHLGVGAARGGAGTYWTQVLGTPSDQGRAKSPASSPPGRKPAPTNG